jgi:hypothetical protein
MKSFIEYFDPRILIRSEFRKKDKIRKKVDNEKITEKKDTEIAIRIEGEGKLINL